MTDAPAPDRSALGHATWRKSTRCTVPDDCVAVARPTPADPSATPVVGIRDTKNPTTHLTFTATAFDTFAQQLTHS